MCSFLHPLPRSCPPGSLGLSSVPGLGLGHWDPSEEQNTVSAVWNAGQHKLPFLQEEDRLPLSLGSRCL